MNNNNNLFHDPKKLRKLVGLTGILLPTSLLIIGLSFPQICTHKTMSEYYFAPFAGDIFVGFLFFIGFFLISYKGDFSYGDDTKWDDRISTFAGICTFGIALFPVEGQSCGFQNELVRAFIYTGQQCSGAICHAIDFVDFSLFSFSASLHAMATLGYFLSLAYFSIFIFTKTSPDGHMSNLKKKRNMIYKISGYTIVLVLILIGAKRFFIDGTSVGNLWDKLTITFFLESLALVSFGFAWWVKGGGFKAVQD
ncbi:MAG: hypothetical protein K6L80_09685 [Agarilytica sp.]